ncbi:MAG: hypothetical protein AB7W59_03315 [Acidimicrobiia bacterium]
MASTAELFRRELRRAGYRLVRKRTHEVWEHPDGQRIVLTSSRLGWRELRNRRADLRRQRCRRD